MLYVESKKVEEVKKYLFAVSAIKNTMQIYFFAECQRKT
jgi:hypothetical protein